MDEARYCRDVCGAKCCHLRLPDEGEPIPCPRLRPDNTCSVYERRYGPNSPDLVVVGYWASRRYRTLDERQAMRPFWCGHIKQLHALGQIPADIAENCCVLRPELLEQVAES